MLHNGMLAGEDMTLQQHQQHQQQQQQQQQHDCVNGVVPYDLGSTMPMFHGYCGDHDHNSLVSAEVLDLQNHKPDTFLGAHDLPTFGDLSLAAPKVVVAGNYTGTTTSTTTTTTTTTTTSASCSSCCQMSMEEEIAVMDEKVCDDVVFIDNNEPNSSKDSLSTKTGAADDDEIVVVVKDCEEKRTEVEAKLESRPKKRTRAVSSSHNSKENSVNKPNYIHVRARRGQATDSHSLAERARREKISKKMKCLQDLVPGCSKIIGKAGVLDEIINYVQSLQRQVEFLSMKLATQNPTLGFNVDEEIPMSSASTNLAELHLIPGQQVTTNYEIERTIYAPQNAVEITTSSVSIQQLYTIDTSCFSQIQPLPTWDSDLLSLEDGSA